jgi:uncharacterized protein (DUF697 family)
MLAQQAGQSYRRITRVMEFHKTVAACAAHRPQLGLYCGNAMAKIDPSSVGWVAAKVESALNKAYATIRVEPDEYLAHLRAAHGLPVRTYDGMFTVPVEDLDAIAQQSIRASMKMAATGGAGFGLGGLLTVVPDVSVLSAITMRTIQKLSLIYGFQFNTDEEVAELWVAAASAAGVDISRELLEKTVITKFVQAVIRRIAAQVSAEMAEKMVARAVPIASSAVGAIINYYFVRAWGRRAVKYFREKHLAERQMRAKHLPIALPPAPEGIS